MSENEKHPLVQLVEFAALHGLAITAGPCKPDEDDAFRWEIGWMDRRGGDTIAWLEDLEDALEVLDTLKDVIAKRQEWHR